MINVFKRDPINIIHWHKEGGEWTQSRLVILGEQPADVKKALDTEYSEFLKGRVRENKILKQYFGPKWRSKLGLDTKEVRGGDNFEKDDYDFDPELVTESKESADLMNPDVPAEPETEGDEGEIPIIPQPQIDVPVEDAELQDAVPVEAEGEISGLDLSQGAAGLEITPQDFGAISLNDLVQSETTATKHVRPVKVARVQFIYEMALFPEDKVSELKYKINAFLNIPIFRQHVWYRAGNQSFPMMYRFYQGSTSTNIDMHNVIHSGSGADAENVLGMPINMNLYRNKDSLRVEAYDNFTLLGHIYSKNGVTRYELVDLETFIGPNREQLSTISKSDKYQLHILYYGFIMPFWPMLNVSAFVEFLDERTIRSSYPLLEPSSDDLSYLRKQQSLVEEMYNLYEYDTNRVNRIDSVLQKSLTETVIKVSSIYKGRAVNLRVLFDLFEVNHNIDALKLYDIYEGKRILLDKYYRDTKRSTEKLIPGVLYFRVVINEQPYQKLNLYLYPNGAYAIKGAWGEDQNYSFEDVNLLVDKHINPIIKKINTMSGQIMYHGSNVRIPQAEKSNVKFIDISKSLFWKKILTTDEFRKLKTVLDRYVSGHIIVEKQVDKNTIQYFFKRGMFEFDPKRIEKSTVIDNYYAYLFNSDVRQKWFLLFENIRVMTVTHRFSDVKIEISGIKEDEYYIFIRYMILLFSQFMRERQDTTSVVEDRKTNMKPLNNLKEQDPHLYNFKKIYNSDFVYSTICQRPYQPALLTQQQYDGLDKKAKANTVKYWNFTTNTDAYYQCPNPKYPHIKFIVDKHPMGYCIPCCKITAPPKNPNDKQRQIYDRCIQHHTFEKREVERSTSRYIMSYGKSIDIGRLSHLPETSLEPLFYETKIEDQGHQATEEDDDELIGAKYYLFGVPQNWNNIKHVGLLHCFSNAMGMNLDALVELIIDKLKSNGHNFQMLLGSNIIHYFRNTNELIEAFKLVFLSGANAVPNRDFDRWNELLMDIAMQYLDIYTIVFEDRDTVIQLRLPDYLHNIADMQFPNHRHLIVLHNLATDYWNPIYIIHKDLYFRAGIVDRKLYNFQSDIVQLIMEMIRIKLRDEIVSKRLTFGILKRFVVGSKRFRIRKILVTRDNLCYGVIIDGVGFVPVHLSHFKHDETIDISFRSSDLVPANHARLLEFIQKYNIWVAHESESNGFIKVDVPLNRPIFDRIEAIYPLIEPDKYLVYRNKTVAFISIGLNFYIDPMVPPRTAKKQQLNYNPLEINEILERGDISNIKEDTRVKTLSRALLSNYTYQLLVLEFIQMFNKQRNTKVRDELKRLFLKTDFKQSTKSLSDQIHAIVLKGFDVQNTMLLADIEKLKSQVIEFMLSGEPKKQLMELVDNEYYNFDMIMVERLKRLPRKQIHEQLKKMATQIVQIGEPKGDFVFPNILQSCQTGEPGYCAKGKLMISKSDLDRYLEVLADQIKNPFVEKYLFSPLFQNSLIDYFSFIRRPNETIEIEFL